MITVRIGDYRVAAELAGFASIERRGLQVQVGQQVALNLQMSPATLQESVTVTGEAPLVDTTASNLGSTIDARQVQDLPVNGRNFMDLTLLAAGSRQNFIAETPAASFQLNVDGQQVTQLIATSFGQPRFSKDTIAEFEVITNRFDARQGARRVSRSTRSRSRAPTPRRDRLPATSVMTGSTRRTSSRRRCCRIRPAVHHDLRRTDQEGSHPLLRQLRVRALAVHAAVHDAVSGLQHQPAGHLHGEEGRRTRRHPVLAEDPLHLSPEPAALVGSA